MHTLFPADERGHTFLLSKLTLRLVDPPERRVYATMTGREEGGRRGGRLSDDARRAKVVSRRPRRAKGPRARHIFTRSAQSYAQHRQKARSSHQYLRPYSRVCTVLYLDVLCTNRQKHGGTHFFFLCASPPVLPLHLSRHLVTLSHPSRICPYLLHLSRHLIRGLLAAEA